MVIYGWSSKKLKQAPFSGKSCSNCENESTLIIVSASYAHVFWIPIFPFKKSLHIVCPNCKHEEKAKDASEEVKGITKQLKASVKTPWYLFSGLILIALIIGFFTVQGALEQNRYESYLENPKVDDVYTLYDASETSEYKYYLWKVINVKGDSVDVSPTSFQYTYIPKQLDAEDGFYDVYFTYHKNDILGLFQTDQLKKVIRGVTEGFDKTIEYVLDSANTDDY